MKQYPQCKARINWRISTQIICTSLKKSSSPNISSFLIHAYAHRSPKKENEKEISHKNPTQLNPTKPILNSEANIIMSVSSRRVLGLYRSMLRLTTRATLDKTHPRQNLLYRYVREQFRANSTEKDANKVRQLYNMGNDLVEYHGTVRHHSVRKIFNFSAPGSSFFALRLDFLPHFSHIYHR